MRKLRTVLANSLGPPKEPLALRVSKTRHGVIATKATPGEMSVIVDNPPEAESRWYGGTGQLGTVDPVCARAGIAASPRRKVKSVEFVDRICLARACFREVAKSMVSPLRLRKLPRANAAGNSESLSWGLIFSGAVTRCNHWICARISKPM